MRNTRRAEYERYLLQAAAARQRAREARAAATERRAAKRRGEEARVLAKAPLCIATRRIIDAHPVSEAPIRVVERRIFDALREGLAHCQGVKAAVSRTDDGFPFGRIEVGGRRRGPALYALLTEPGVRKRIVVDGTTGAVVARAATYLGAVQRFARTLPGAPGRGKRPRAAEPAER